MDGGGKLRFYDFFAGAGLATLGLRRSWQCIWANDISPRKAAIYRANFGDGHFHLGDVTGVSADSLPRPASMAWASFPCQDLSLAGWRKGLAGERSGVFWAFWRILRELAARGERPGLVALENVPGLLYGDGFNGLAEALAALDMQFGALVMDARWFLPQSRPRVFVVAADRRLDAVPFAGEGPSAEWSPPPLLAAHDRLPAGVRDLWRWWRVPAPRGPVPPLAGMIAADASGIGWHTKGETARLLELMSPANRAKIEAARAAGSRQIGFLYRRMRRAGQRAEVRFDGLAGCLRTPRGGSSRQTVVVVEEGRVRTRLLSAREAARLMGAPDGFALPERYNEAYQAMGDGVAVPVVAWLSERLLKPLAEALPAAAGRPLAETAPHAALAEQRAAEWLAARGQL